MFKGTYERQYIEALREIYENGFADGVNERTGKSTKRLPGIVFQVDVEKEFPILKSKFVAGKTALREILWIWQQQSNNIHDLKAKIWDDWADENGSINKAYGFQMNRPVCIFTDTIHRKPESFRCYPDQATFVLEYLREFPNGRWAVSTLWNTEELSRMNLVPCCHTSTWNLDGGRLNCILDQRSGDMPYGVPFNTTQYAELMILLARDLGVRPGLLTHVIADAHIYENQMDGVELQLASYNVLKTVGCSSSVVREGVEKYLDVFSKVCTKQPVPTFAHVVELATNAVMSTPMFVVEGSEKFFEVKAENCIISDYSNMGKIDFGEVAV